MTPTTTQCATYSGDSNDCSALLAMSGTFVLLTVSLMTVVLVQCVLILRMRRSTGAAAIYISPNELYSEAKTSSSTTRDAVPMAHIYNEAYSMHNMASGKGEAEYETIK